MGGDGELLLLGLNINGGWPPIFEFNPGTTIYSVKFKALQDLNSLEGIIGFSANKIPRQTVYITEFGWELYLVENIFNGVILSSEDNKSLEAFDLAPNPTEDKTFVNIQFNQVNEGELKLRDMNGRLINAWRIKGQDFQKSISLQYLAQGTYVLELRTNKGVETRKILKY